VRRKQLFMARAATRRRGVKRRKRARIFISIGGVINAGKPKRRYRLAHINAARLLRRLKRGSFSRRGASGHRRHHGIGSGAREMQRKSGRRRA